MGLGRGFKAGVEGGGLNALNLVSVTPFGAIVDGIVARDAKGTVVMFVHSSWRDKNEREGLRNT